MSISFSSDGSYKETEKWLRRMMEGDIYSALSKFGDEGVAALSAATPVDQSTTANSWSYEIKEGRGTWAIIWNNSHIVDGTPVAVLLQHGHGTGTGGYVQGRDFINPAMRPIFDRIVAAAEKVVNSA